MGKKTKIYESDYLAYELMLNTNIDFVLKEFTHIEELIKLESGWEAYPDWLEYLSNRPIGNKPYKTNLDISEFCDFLKSNHFSEFEEFEIIADENGVYAYEIKTSNIYSNSIYAVVFSGQNDTIEYLCVIPLDQDDILIVEELDTLVKFIVDKYNLILVNWNDRRVN